MEEKELNVYERIGSCHQNLFPALDQNPVRRGKKRLSV